MVGLARSRALYERYCICGFISGAPSGIQRRAALVIALTANWLDRERLAVVAMVVMERLGAAVRAREVAGVHKLAETDRTGHLVVGFALRRAEFGVDRHSSVLLLGGDWRAKKDVWMVEHHLGRNAALGPVMNPLHTALAVAEHLHDLRHAAEAFDE